MPLLFLLFLVVPLAAAAQDDPFSFTTTTTTAGMGYAATSVNATIFRGDALTTFGDRQYAAYYAGDGTVVIALRTLGDSVWHEERTQYRGTVADAHNVISIAVDGEGVLHVAFDSHNSRLRYCRSIAPCSTTLGDEEPMIGSDEERVTYPQFLTMPSGVLLFVYREGQSGAGNLVVNRYDPATRRWQRQHTVLIDGEGQRSAYWQMCCDEQGTLHLSWLWRDTDDVASNHDLCYARSYDDGETWYTTSGEECTLPLRAATAEYAWRIPTSSEMINQTTMAADSAGHPYIATYWRDKESGVPQYMLVWHNGTKWQQHVLSRHTADFSLQGTGTKRLPLSRPLLLVAGDEGWLIVRTAEQGDVVGAYHTSSLSSGTWTYHTLFPYPVDAWEPLADMSLWRTRRLLHLFVVSVAQGDGEGMTRRAPQPVQVVEVHSQQ